MSYLTRKEMRTYVDQLSDLPIDKQHSVNHEDCPAGKDTKSRLFIKRRPECYLFYCHHCSQRGYYRTDDKLLRVGEAKTVDVESETESVRELALSLNTLSGTVTVKSWPIEAQLWWLSYGLTQEDATNNLVQWYGDRLWLNAGGTAWQGRSFDPKHHKYLTVVLNKRMPAIFLSDVSTRKLVIVEDIVSAYKVHKAGYNVMCLMGTTLQSHHTDYATKYSKIKVWLDNDVAGTLSATIIHKKLNGLVTKGVDYVSFKQPKEASFKEIKELLDA